MRRQKLKLFTVRSLFLTLACLATTACGKLWTEVTLVKPKLNQPSAPTPTAPLIYSATWVGGSNTNSQRGTYGVKGTGSTVNIPGARYQSASWTDSSGNFWLFGGGGFDSTGTQGCLNDLWKYDPNNQEWTWVSGSSVVQGYPTYGTKGLGSTANIPGCRTGSSSWVDGSGNLWLFGGQGIDSTSNVGELNDLWEFNPGTLQWTWIGGSNISDDGGTYGTQGVGSTANIPQGRDSGNSWVDGSGNFWLFGGEGNDLLNDLWMFNPGTLQWTWVSGRDTPGQSGTYGTQGAGSTANAPGGRLWSSVWVDTSQNIWIFSGSGYDINGNQGEMNDLWKFNSGTLEWTWIGGSNTYGQTATYGTQGVGSTLNNPGARDSEGAWTDSSGNFWLFGGYRSAGSARLSDFWEFTPGDQKWTWIDGTQLAAQEGVYGTEGTPNPSNILGGRNASLTWIDSSNNLWIFGGYGFDSAGNVGTLNDLWKLTR